jgi:hypothetical protein
VTALASPAPSGHEPRAAAPRAVRCPLPAPGAAESCAAGGLLIGMMIDSRRIRARARRRRGGADSIADADATRSSAARRSLYSSSQLGLGLIISIHVHCHVSQASW